MRLEFTDPDLLYLLFLLPLWWLVVWPRKGGGVLYARGGSAGRLTGWWGQRSWVVLTLPRVLRGAAMACLIVALAGPVRIEIVEEGYLEGKVIGLALDISGSMLSMDMEDGRSRLEIAREAAIGFAEGRPVDDLSLVAFAGEAITRMPPTADANLIVSAVEGLEVDLVHDGTDISAALLTSVARVRESEREGRVVVLLTDGAHNGGGVLPVAAARAAAGLGVKVHSISVLPPEFRRTRFAEDMETVLAGVSGLTGGQYFHASTAAALDSIYRTIDMIETPTPRVRTLEVRYPERAWLLLAGLLLLGLDAMLRGTRWGLVP
jgi:Ca-activated chloride channel family protein